MTPQGLLILGFGGHARSVADVALDLGIPRLAFVEAHVRPGDEFAGFPVVASMPGALQPGWAVLPAAGDNAERRLQFEGATSRAWPIERLISKRAYCGKGATIGAGSFVAHHAHLGPMVRVGRAAIINTAAVVDHESKIGDFAHVSVNTTIAGRCQIGNFVFVGAGATVIDKVRVADHVIIGAGATVVDDITEAGIYVGCPARRVEGK